MLEELRLDILHSLKRFIGLEIFVGSTMQFLIMYNIFNSWLIFH